MAYKGSYKPFHPEKYKGDPNRIKYRSLWERNCMKTFDSNPNILAWMSEEFSIPYISPVDGKQHQYFPDFFVKVKTRDGSEKKILIEVKPAKQCEPPKIPKSGRKTKRYFSSMATYAVNKAKWYFAEQWCQKYGYDFKIMTELDCN